MSPSHAERVRTILATQATAMLATVDIDGRPVIGPVPMVADAAGVPVMVISNLSTHSSRGRRDARAAVNVGDHVLIQGDLRPVPGLQQIELTEVICAVHPHLRDAIESLDWSWLRLEPSRVRFTDERGDERWIRPADVAGAEPDPLVPLGRGFVDDAADKLADQVLLMAKTLGGRWLATAAEVTEIDRYGVVLSVAEPAGVRPTRVPFPERLDSADEVHHALGALVMAARAAARRDDVPDNPTEWPEPEAATPSSEEPSAPTQATGGALIDGLRLAAAQTAALGPQLDDQSILLTAAELYDGDVRPWRDAEPTAPFSGEILATGGSDAPQNDAC